MFDTLVSSFGIKFALRARQNIEIFPRTNTTASNHDQDGTQWLFYMEDVSLTKSGGLNLNSKKVDPKIVRVYEDEEYVLKKCVVKFFIKKYVLCRLQSIALVRLLDLLDTSLTIRSVQQSPLRGCSL